MTTQAKRPNSRANLDKAIDRISALTGEDPFRMKRLLAAVIVGQVLPDGAAKGGNALKIRFGNATARFSRDLDAARISSLEDYISTLGISSKRAGTALPALWCRESRLRPKAYLPTTSCSHLM